MQNRDVETFAVLVAEWVIGDLGITVRQGDKIRWLVRTTEGGDEEPAARVILRDRAAAGQPGLPIFALHSDDPEPPTSVVGRVTLIQALQWSQSPNGDLAQLFPRPVPVARSDISVEDYLVHVEGAIGIGHPFEFGQ